MAVIEKTYQEHVELAEAYKALGQTDIWLHRSYGTQSEDVWLKDLPWDLVTDVENGGSYRYRQPISYTMTAEHPSGLTFKWFVGIEDDHSGSIKLDYDRIRTVLFKMPYKVQDKFRVLLLQNYLDARTDLKEFMKHVEAKQANLATLEEIVFNLTKP